MKKKHVEAQKQLMRKLMDKGPNQSKAPGEIQGFSKHLKKNNGQGNGQRVKAHS
ncbi:MAG: hypothetical protein K2Q18_16525 [Bdellovibrionales bacterium]|nr:hypothetical protein [Bdellovibrionales bacterium]